MNYKTHKSFGVLSALIYMMFARFSLAGLFIASLAAAFPDIDHSHSTFGKFFKPLNSMIGHRTITHSLTLMTALTYLFSLFLPQYTVYFIIGYLSHLFLDCLNHQGLTLFYPLPDKFSFKLVKTGSKSEFYMRYTIIILVLVLLYYFLINNAGFLLFLFDIY